MEVGINKAISVNEQKERQAQIEFQKLTRVDYEQLKPGMSVTDVQAILDRGIEINRSETTATFFWQNSDSSHITVIFKNGKLMSKAQSKLN
ncbi:hypothetical protein F8S20_25620 [Nostoc sp. BAE]|nr:hypothetical protein [Nostoc commune BAE]